MQATRQTGEGPTNINDLVKKTERKTFSKSV